ncbi:hypothetical protein [Streptomyces sp. TRM75563]|nr:hypothetical protein [Streptomyces sp. TRM75563]
MPASWPEAFTRGAGTALRVAALVVLITGALVVTGARRGRQTAPR